MKQKWLVMFIAAGSCWNSAKAQGTEKAIGAAMFSYFTAGFALLFFAAFAFSFVIKTIINQKSPKWSGKQILYSSLRIGLITAVALIILIYLFLRS
ncbi:MAG: hypothetical protein V4561_07775 [Bacteroidota bacterium]